MCSTLWVERFIDRNEKGEKKNGEKIPLDENYSAVVLCNNT
jgi:hypothetical protein